MAATYYAQVLREWDWKRIAADIKAAAEELTERIAAHTGDGDIKDIVVEVGVASAGYDWEACCWTSTCWLGTCYAVMPSGKFYMPWTSNQTAEDVDKDQRYYAALEKAADKYDLYVSGGEDIRIERSIDDIEED